MTACQQEGTITGNEEGNMETTKHAPNPARKRYATYLRPDSIKDLRRHAFEHDVPDYRIVQAAIDDYLSKRMSLRLPIGQ